MAAVLDQLRVLIENVIEFMGYPGIALVMFVENLFPPIPSELVMPFAGFLVAEGQFSFWAAVLAGTTGSVAGALVIYYIGMWANEPLIRAFVRRYGRYFMLSEQDIDRALGVFERHGEIIVFVGRLIPLIRSLISLPAGMQRMPLPRFLVFTALGSALWTALLSGAGVMLGENWEQVLHYVDRYQNLTLAALGLGAIVFVVRRVRQLQACRTDPEVCQG